MTSPRQYFLSHTFLLTSLDDVLSQIKMFLDSHPTEIVTIEAKPDFEVFNSSTCLDKSIVERIDEFETYWLSDLRDYIDNYLGNDMIIDEIDGSTKVWELVHKNKRVLLIINYFTCLADPDKRAYQLRSYGKT